MKKIALILLLFVSSQAFADGYYHGYRHHYSPMYMPTVLPSVYYAPAYYNPPVINTYPSAADILLPMAVGGVIGYALADKPSSSASSSSSRSASNAKSGEPLYQYQIIHDAECDCDKRVLVRVE